MNSCGYCGGAHSFTGHTHSESIE
nr:hypothetical protein [Agrobacterium larrymoorei]